MSSPDLAGFSASGQPKSGRELRHPIDWEVCQARVRSSKGGRETGFLVIGRFRVPRLWLHVEPSFLFGDMDSIPSFLERFAQPEEIGCTLAVSDLVRGWPPSWCRRWSRLVDDSRHRFASSAA